MFEATQDGLRKNAPVHSIHGSFLAVGELLRNTGEFIMSRHREVADIVLRYLEHKDRLVRLSITSLLPRIAHFLRAWVVTNYLQICMNHILTILRIPAECDSGFIALGEMASALDGELFNHMPTIAFHLHEAIAPRKGKPPLEAFACVGNITKAMGLVMEPYVHGLLVVMFSAGISTTLVGALEQLVEKLLIAAVADVDVTVRHSIFSSFQGNRGFDEFLAQADNLTAVFSALNDEDFDVQEYAILLAGRLSEKNPAYVLPALRRLLVQLLAYLDQS